MTITASRAHSIDEVLGDAADRFFASGFSRVRHSIGELRVGAGACGAMGVAAKASLSYPEDWSKKRDVMPLRPHLSTVDAFVIGVQLAEAFAVHTIGVPVEAREWLWVKRCEFRSGTAAQEDLASFDVGATLTAITPTETPLGLSYAASFDCTIGAIKLSLQLEVPRPQMSFGTLEFATIDDALGDATSRFYGDGYKNRRHRIDKLDLSAGDHITASVTVDSGMELRYQDVESQYCPSVSMLDCILAQAQITQVLMYALDDVRRQDSNTLWMRRVVLQSRSPVRPAELPFVASATVTKSRLMTMNGAAWRSADFVGDFHGISAAYNLAHQLPATN